MDGVEDFLREIGSDKEEFTARDRGKTGTGNQKSDEERKIS